jgi:hypothetical protein
MQIRFISHKKFQQLQRRKKMRKATDPHKNIFIGGEKESLESPALFMIRRNYVAE